LTIKRIGHTFGLDHFVQSGWGTAMAPMQTLAFLTALSVCGCASSPTAIPPSPVAVTATEPAGCRFVGEVSGFVCSHDAPATTPPWVIESFKDQARARGGNTLQCCTIGDEVLVVLGVNPRTGEACADHYQHEARIYACPAPAGDH
jgi:hypothetical protein